MPALVVNVTAEDIFHGKRRDCRSCPIARAIERCGLFASVAREEAYIFHTDDDNEIGAEVSLPQEARDFISHFDAGLSVEPFTFELDIDR